MLKTDFRDGENPHEISVMIAGAQVQFVVLCSASTEIS
jgi:hypothetical protein